MPKALPFTELSLARAIRGVHKAGLHVIGVKPDGSLIVSDKPIDVDSLFSAEPRKSSEAPKRRFGDYLNGGQSEPASKWEDQPVGAATESEEMATPLRAYDILTSRRRGGSWGAVITIDDPKLIERYRAAGYTLYEDGELEELIRKSPMGKRETAALGGFFRARGEPVDIKGAGLQITSRLVTRGYIEVAEGKHRITPAGKAEWLRLTNGDDRADQP